MHCQNMDLTPCHFEPWDLKNPLKAIGPSPGIKTGLSPWQKKSLTQISKIGHVNLGSGIVNPPHQSWREWLSPILHLIIFVTVKAILN